MLTSSLLASAAYNGLLKVCIADAPSWIPVINIGFLLLELPAFCLTGISAFPPSCESVSLIDPNSVQVPSGLQTRASHDFNRHPHARRPHILFHRRRLDNRNDAIYAFRPSHHVRGSAFLDHRNRRRHRFATRPLPARCGREGRKRNGCHRRCQTIHRSDGILFPLSTKQGFRERELLCARFDELRKYNVRPVCSGGVPSRSNDRYWESACVQLG